MLLEALSAPLYLVVQAQGRIRNYQIIVSLLFCLNVVLSYVFLSLDYQPIVVVVIRVIVSLLLLLFRVVYVSNKIEYKLTDYMSNVIKPIVRVVSLSLVVPIICIYLGVFEDISVFEGIYNIVMLVLLTFLIIYIVGLKRNERTKLSNMVVNKVKSIIG